jgi:uncharacterized protein
MLALEPTPFGNLNPQFWGGIAPPLKALAFFGAWLLLWLPIAIPLARHLQWRPPHPPTIAQKLPLLASLYLLALPLLWVFATLDGGSLSLYGLPAESAILGSLLQGVILGVLGLAVMYAIEWGLGWVKWQAVPKVRDLWLPLVLGLWVGLTEELIFRGFLLHQLPGISPWAAGAIASLVFALLHLVWEGKENIPQLPGLWLMGMVLTIAFWVNGNLGMAWGLHAGWIWAIATLDTAATMVPTGKVAPWLTGLENKPLAGLTGILFLLGTAGVLGLLGSLLGYVK